MSDDDETPEEEPAVRPSCPACGGRTEAWTLCGRCLSAGIEAPPLLVLS